MECWLPQSFLPFLHLFYDYLVSFLALHKIRRRLFFYRFSFSVSISIPIFVDCHSFYYCCHCHWIVYIKYNVIDRRGTTFFCFVSSDAIFRFRYPFSGFFDRFFSSSAICIGWVFCIRTAFCSIRYQECVRGTNAGDKLPETPMLWCWCSLETETKLKKNILPKKADLFWRTLWVIHTIIEQFIDAEIRR